MIKPELLAPAGDMACFMAAINAGADAVYLGGDEFGARAYASNFSRNELCEAISYAHLFGVKVYLTVNTLVKEREFANLIPFLQPFYEAGLDGVIVQDLGVLKAIKEHFPKLLLHASTQMCITNSYGASLLKQYGVVRVVPARELSLKEMKHIKDTVGIEIESFIHGAMCYGYSGQCLFSSFLGGRSGNRGRCAGPCRLPYQAFGKKEVYPLSLKDMCTVQILNELIDAGIDSFKIEGRMKNPYYVAGVVAIYRKYIDLYCEEKDSKREYRVDMQDIDLLKKLYIRTALQDGYYHKHSGAEMVTLDKPGYLSSDESEFDFIKKTYLDINKKLLIYGNISLRVGSKAEITVWDSNDHYVSIMSEELIQKANNRPVTKEDVLKQMYKTGNTPFNFLEFSVIMDDSVFISLKTLGELRRTALAMLFDEIVDSANPNVKNKVSDIVSSSLLGKEDIEKPIVDITGIKENVMEDIELKGRFRISLHTIQQLSFLLNHYEEYTEIDAIEINAFLLQDLYADLLDELKTMKAREKKIYIVLPPVFRNLASDWIDKYKDLIAMDVFSGIYCNGIDALSYIVSEPKFHSKEIYADYALYSMNTQSYQFLTMYKLTGLVVPYELTHFEWLDILKANEQIYDQAGEIDINHLKKRSNMYHEYLVYGHIPFMRTANCVKKTFGKCNHKCEVVLIKDRTGKAISVYNQCEVCENTIYNGVPLSLHKEINKIKADIFRISFTIESETEMKNVLDLFIKNIKVPEFEYTKGHFKKGIE